MLRFLMTITWVALILGVAIWTQSQGMSDSASFGVIAGLSGAAWGTMHSDLGCGRRCAQ
ncbi:MAG: hypothetical protein AAGK01_10855 [Pseudomonadota bacterium]